MFDRKKILMTFFCVAFLSISSITIAWDIPKSPVVHRWGKNIFLNSCHVIESNQLTSFPTLFQYVFTSGVEVPESIDFVKEENTQYVKDTTSTSETEPVTEVVTDTMYGDTYLEKDEPIKETSASNDKSVKTNNQMVNTLKKNLDVNYLIQNFYIVDATTSIDKKQFNVSKLLSKDVSIKKDSNKKQILIYHTHAASEAFSDSKEGKEEDTIVGVGTELAKILEEKYGYGVIHDKTKYDVINGVIDRNKAYVQSLKGVTKILSENKDIQVVIDLHRDGVPEGTRTFATVDGKKCAQVMLFNGLSRNKTGNIEYLHNPNLEDNLAFSLQLKIAGMEKYPGLTKPVYLKGYRYNLHLAKRSLLIELGNQNNTVSEEKNTMPALANMIDSVLK